MSILYKTYKDILYIIFCKKKNILNLKFFNFLFPQKDFPSTKLLFNLLCSTYTFIKIKIFMNFSIKYIIFKAIIYYIYFRQQLYVYIKAFRFNIPGNLE